MTTNNHNQGGFVDTGQVELEPGAAPRFASQGVWPAWLVLALSLLVTLGVWRWAGEQARQAQQAEFLARSAEIGEALQGRMAGYQQILRAAAALFAASDRVTRTEWRNYYRSLQFGDTYPAILALAFARSFTHEEAEGVARDQRAQGFADFTLRPPGRRERYVANVYTEPYEGVHIRAIGYDMWQDAERRKTMERALATRQPAITPKITLKIDEETAPVPAFIMYLPAFDRGGRLRGFVLSPFRMPALAADLESWVRRGVSFAIYDGAEADEKALLHRSGRAGSHRPLFARSEIVSFAGRQWRLDFASEPSLETSEEARAARFALAAGILLSLALFWVVRGIATGRRRALALAREMTAELREKQRVLTDEIAERKRSEAQLKLAASVFEQANEAITITDADATIVAVNRRFTAITGYRADEVIGNNPRILQSGRQDAAFYRAMWAALTTGGHWDGEIWNRRKDGAIYPEWLSISAVRGEDGMVTNYVAVFSDLTERKAAEEAIRRMNRELERRVDDRTRELRAAVGELEAFSYSVSHDLRAPLRAINGFSQLLEQDCAESLDETARGYLARVRAGSIKMGNLIDDLHELSRVTRQNMRLEPVDLSLLASEIAAELAEAEPARRVEWAIAPGIAATCDAGLMRAALANLLGNAWKYTGRRERARIEFGVEEQGGEPVYIVRDDGAGFDMRYAGKLFGAFQRLHGPAEFAGSGIGLATVARIVHRHGGRVWGEGKVGEGAVFRFTLGGARP